MRHLIDSTDLSVAEIDRVLNLADDIIRDPRLWRLLQGEDPGHAVL